MAFQTRQVSVYGSRPPCAYLSRLNYRRFKLRMAKLEQSIKSDKLEEFMLYDEEEENNEMTLNTIQSCSYSVVDYIRNREYGMKEYRPINKSFATNQILTQGMLKECYIPLNTLNKVLCSQWLNDKQIVFGTKCNKLMVYNLKSHELDQIPSIKGQVESADNEQNGIYALQINRSRTLLATGAYNSNEIAVYSVPTFDQIALTKNFHSDQILDIEWLDDEYFVSVSHDTQLVLWRIQYQYHETYDSDGGLVKPVTQFVYPSIIKTCKTSQKTQAIHFNEKFKEIVTLSVNGYVNVWNSEYLKQIFSRKLPPCQENTRLAMKSDGSFYAVGCHRYTLVLDPRTLDTIRKIPTRYGGCGIRSLSIQDYIVTIGTGAGVIMFYDVRAAKYLDSSTNSNRALALKSSQGYVNPEAQFMMQQDKYTPAIYTHCYDYSGTRLFSAGGPLKTDICGNYAAIWQ